MASNIEKLLAKIEENTRGSGGAGLPAVTNEDNGDVLTVVNGVWDKAAPSGGGGALIVHGEADETTGVITLDKTWAEINGAVPLVWLYVANDISMYFPLVQCNEDSGEYWCAFDYSVMSGDSPVISFMADSETGYPHSVED